MQIAFLKISSYSPKKTWEIIVDTSDATSQQFDHPVTYEVATLFISIPTVLSIYSPGKSDF